jgi:hypothetical protein
MQFSKCNWCSAESGGDECTTNCEKRYKNIPNDRLIEDPIFRSSARSYFLQLADFVAYALLKSETTVTPLVQRYGLHECYDRLKPIVITKASAKDPKKLGIVRT